MILKKPGIAVNNPFLLCWHGDSLAGSTNSLKPHALRVPAYRRAGLDRIRSASSPGTCASKAKKAKGEFPGRLSSECGVHSRSNRLSCAVAHAGETFLY
jgi:hypothetical protein